MSTIYPHFYAAANPTSTVTPFILADFGRDRVATRV